MLFIFVKIQYSSFPLFPVAYPFRIATQLQYYVKREKCKVNDVIFPSGCEARAINLGNKNMEIGSFTGGTSVRSKNIFTDISRYPTGKHEITGCMKQTLVIFDQDLSFKNRCRNILYKIVYKSADLDINSNKKFVTIPVSSFQAVNMLLFPVLHYLLCSERCRPVLIDLSRSRR